MAKKVQDAEKVHVATMYLSDDAKLWWRTIIRESETNGSHPMIETWDDTKKELRAQFLPTNTAWQVR